MALDVLVSVYSKVMVGNISNLAMCTKTVVDVLELL